MPDRYIRMNILTSGGDKAKATLDDLAKSVRELNHNDPRITPKVDDTEAEARIKGLRAQFMALNRMNMKLGFDVNTEKAKAQVLSMRAELRGLSEELTKLGAADVDPKVALRGGDKMEAQLIKIKLLMDSINQDITDSTTTKGGFFSRIFHRGGNTADATKVADKAGGKQAGVLRGLFAGGPGSALSALAGSPAGAGAIGLGVGALTALIPGLIGLGTGGLVGAGVIGGGIAGASAGNTVLKADTSNIKQITTALKTATGSQKVTLQGDLTAANKQFAKDSTFFQPFIAFQKSLKDLIQPLLGPLRTVMAPLVKIVQQFADGLKMLGPVMTQMFKASLPFVKAFAMLMLQSGKIIFPAFTQAMNEMVRSGALKLMMQGLVILIKALAQFIVEMGPNMRISAAIFAGVMTGLGKFITGLAIPIDVIIGLWRVMANLALNLARIVGDVLTGNFGKLGGVFSNFGHNVAKVFTDLRHQVSSILDNLGLAKFGHELANVFDGMRHEVAHVWDGMWLDTIGRAIRGGHDVERAWNALWGWVGRVLDGYFAGVAKRYSAFWNSTTHWFDRIRHDVSSIWDAFWRDIGKSLANAFLNYIGLTTAFRHDIAHIFDLIRHDVSATWDALFRWVSNNIKTNVTYYLSVFSKFRHDIVNVFDFLRHDVTSNWDSMFNQMHRIVQTGISKIGSALMALKSAFMTPVRWVVDNVWDRLAGIWNRITSIVHISSIKLPQPHMAAGGIVPGSGRGDIVPAMLEPGERVLSNAQVSAAGGHAVLDMIFGRGSGGPVGYAGGGIIPGIGHFFSGLGHNILGWLSKPLSFLTSKLFGGITSMLGQIPGVGTVPAEGMMLRNMTGDIIKALVGALHTQGQAMGGHGGVMGAYSHSAALAQAYARSLLSFYHWGQSQMNSLIPLWNQESGWNAYAVNPTSGAYGIPQSLGHGHPYNLGDYKNQVIWGLNYIRGRYGSPAGAWAHEQANNWYGNGGWITEPVIGTGLRSGQSYGFGELGPEYVSPAGSRGMGGGNTYNINVAPTPLAHPRDVGRAVVHAIREYEKGSGTGWRNR